MPLSLNEWLELLEIRHPRTIDLGLERTTEVWQRMGSPQPATRIFTVAGTNGKGSTVAYLCGMLHQFGYSYGCYTTPHLLTYNERIQINGICCNDDQLIAAFERVDNARGDVSLTYFEFGTLAAISIMSAEKLDYAVMEVGLGGRLDAVNILDADCTVITPIGLDHQEYLGPDIESIGREKAGIIRAGVPLICGEPQPPASILAIAGSMQAPLWRLGCEFETISMDDGLHFRKDGMDLPLPWPAMRGEHQVNNMATAVAAFMELVPGVTSQWDLLVRGLQNIRVAGRMQQLSERPLVWVDVGHNPLAAAAIARVLQSILEIRPEARCLCLIGMLADKDAAAASALLGPFVDAWYCASLPGPRGQTGLQLAERIAPVAGSGGISAFVDVAAAMEQLFDDCRPDDCVLVFGSFLTAAAAIEWWREARPALAGGISPASAG